MQDGLAISYETLGGKRVLSPEHLAGSLQTLSDDEQRKPGAHELANDAHFQQIVEADHLFVIGGRIVLGLP